MKDLKWPNHHEESTNSGPNKQNDFLGKPNTHPIKLKVLFIKNDMNHLIDISILVLQGLDDLDRWMG